MNKKLLAAGLILIVVALGFYIVALSNDTSPVPIINHQNGTNATAINNFSTTKIILNNAIDANNLFALDLYSKYKSENTNIFFSPFSISSALAMTYEGAKGKTAEEMQNVLHIPSDKNKTRSDYLSIYNEINKANKPYKLSTANALWAQNDYQFVSDYLVLVNNSYDGKVTNLDFKTQTEKSRVTINDWVAQKTNVKIIDLIPKGLIDPNTRLVLTNAVYFKANWSKQFDAEDTTDGKFTLSSGNQVNARLMHQTSYFNYAETDSLQMLEMNYLGDDLSMLVILPKENNISLVESQLTTPSFLQSLKNRAKEENVNVVIPKFKFGTKYIMSSDLKSMGMPSAFNPDEADFSGMAISDKLFIGEVVHQTFVEVAEYGTEAAAATAVMMRLTSAPPQEKKDFIADHPFIFVIQQKSTGNVLFMGRVSDPSK